MCWFVYTHDASQSMTLTQAPTKLTYEIGNTGSVPFWNVWVTAIFSIKHINHGSDRGDIPIFNRSMKQMPFLFRYYGVRKEHQEEMVVVSECAVVKEEQIMIGFGSSSIILWIRQSVSPSVSLSVHQSVSPSVCLSVFQVFLNGCVAWLKDWASDERPTRCSEWLAGLPLNQSWNKRCAHVVQLTRMLNLNQKIHCNTDSRQSWAHCRFGKECMPRPAWNSFLQSWGSRRGERGRDFWYW